MSIPVRVITGRQVPTPAPPPKPVAPPPPGPGTHLARILAKFGVAADETCDCKTHIRQMDRWGPDECERHVEQIVGWLRAGAADRGWAARLLARPFLLRPLVRQAIAAARVTAAA